MDTYEIIRFYSDGRDAKTIRSGLTLEQAKEHCNDPRTAVKGKYFDGFNKE